MSVVWSYRGAGKEKSPLTADEVRFWQEPYRLTLPSLGLYRGPVGAGIYLPISSYIYSIRKKGNGGKGVRNGASGVWKADSRLTSQPHRLTIEGGSRWATKDPPPRAHLRPRPRACGPITKLRHRGLTRDQRVGSPKPAWEVRIEDLLGPPPAVPRRSHVHQVHHTLSVHAYRTTPGQGPKSHKEMDRTPTRIFLETCGDSSNFDPREGRTRVPKPRPRPRKPASQARRREAVTRVILATLFAQTKVGGK